jgi:hypothetical protein
MEIGALKGFQRVRGSKTTWMDPIMVLILRFANRDSNAFHGNLVVF